MRVIEKEMLIAIEKGKEWSKDNTRVRPMGGVTMIYLHGHHIATVTAVTGEVEVNHFTLCKWPTNTTKSRLRALNVDVCTRKGVTYLYGEAL